MSDSDSDLDIYADIYSDTVDNSKHFTSQQKKRHRIDNEGDNKRDNIGDNIGEKGLEMDHMVGSAEGIEQLGEDALLPPKEATESGPKATPTAKVPGSGGGVGGGGSGGGYGTQGGGGGGGGGGIYTQGCDEALKRENDVLKRNISALYRTARAELRRRDRERDEMRLQIKDLKAKRNQGSKVR
jgi:hypothetical protein